MVTQQPPPSYLYNVMLSLSFVIAQFIVLDYFSHYISFILQCCTTTISYCDSSVFEIDYNHRNR